MFAVLDELTVMLAIMLLNGVLLNIPVTVGLRLLNCPTPSVLAGG